ncbi:excinuclease ABC subunit UvrA [soil metagenome]
MPKKKSSPDYPPIIVRGARTHNLKSISCEIPAHKITVMTGVSGSGKSSLAFDTIFAEGQRRYVESLSTYARQFIARMARPDVDGIENIPPAIALEQKNHVRNARSTVGTGTEVNDYLRLLFAKIGRIICPKTGERVRRDSPEAAVNRLLEIWDGQRVFVIAPVRLQESDHLARTLKELQRQGFTRIMVGNDMMEIDQPDFVAPTGLMEIRIVVDRLAISRPDRSRLAEAIETTYRISGGRTIIRTRDGEERLFSQDLRCESCPGTCGMFFQEPTVQLLNFSSPLGACPTCQGFGRVTGVDWGKIIPDPRVTLNGGAIACWNGESGGEWLADLRARSRELDIRMNIPWSSLSDREQDLVRNGLGKWDGVRGYFTYLESKRYKMQARIAIARYRGYTDCPDCHGWRLRPEANVIHIAGKNIGQLCEMQVKDLIVWFDALKLSGEDTVVGERPLEEVRSRLGYLSEVGLGYLTLARQTRTLSGGESQRINLSTALGSALTDTLYVLDEPTVGLHPRDTQRLIGVIEKLRDLGNSLILVEHDLDVIRAADHLIDIGPGAGEKGGEIIFAGPLSAISAAANKSRTAQYLLEGDKSPPLPAKSRKNALNKFGRKSPEHWITIRGASENNLKHVTAKIPLGVMCCVTGVSGSGKSTLIKTCLYQNYLRSHLGDSSAEPGEILALEGLDQIDGIVMVDQSAIGRSSRSNAATYLKAYDGIRDLLASTPDSETAGLKPRDFSFNVPGGRCEACEGTGYQTIDMHFLADVEAPCDVCEGARFNDTVLDMKYNGLNVSGILELTVDEACLFFEKSPRILNGLEPLSEVGLGYLRLGQSTATLSGGEAQRLKLAAHIAGVTGQKNMLLLFDEPTAGLHASDLDVLLKVFRRLLDRGFSLVVIEHNLQLIRQADYIIDMGPEGGEEGGRIVAEGTPEEIAAAPDSITGQYLSPARRSREKAPAR